jgi:hypothetical protein
MCQFCHQAGHESPALLTSYRLFTAFLCAEGYRGGVLGTTPQVTSLPASSVSKEELRVILAEYLALDRARVFRRLFVVRFGLLTTVSVLVALIAPGLPAIARWLPPVLCLTPPTWAALVELRLARRLTRHLEGVEGLDAHELTLGRTNQST